MRPQTIRRLLVFAVCCAGVAALYLVPGTAESPDQVSTGPGTQPDRPTRTVTKQPDPTRTPSPQTSVSATPAVPTATETVTARQSATSSQSPRPEPTSSSSTPEESDPPKPEPSPTATATDEPEDPEPEPTNDPPADPPEKVEDLKELEATHDDLTLRWSEPEADQDIKKYRIYLNGTRVEAQHPDRPTEGTIEWDIYTDDGYFVQVSAVDIDDQEGELSDRLTVTRPEDPSPSPSPTDSPEGEKPEGEEPDGERAPSPEPTR